MRIVSFATALLLVSSCARGPAYQREQAWKTHDELQRQPAAAPAPAPAHNCVAKEGPNCRAKIRWICPAGFIDGCDTAGSTGKHICVENEDRRAGCEREIALQCEEGLIDGCLIGASKSHRCVAAPGKVPCTEAAPGFSCPLNFRDACGESAFEPGTQEGEEF